MADRPKHPNDTADLVEYIIEKRQNFSPEYRAELERKVRFQLEPIVAKLKNQEDVNFLMNSLQ